MSSALVPQVRGDPYIRLKQLGQGSFGRVLLVRDSRDGQLYVLKEVDLQQFGAKGKKEALKEVAFLNQLSHPYIIKYVEYFEKQGGGTSMPLLQNSNDPSSKFDTGNKPMLFIVMEHANGGDLDAKIKQQRKLGQPFTEKQILEYFCQIVLALKHIHDRKILHRFVTQAGKYTQCLVVSCSCDS
jgi:NIMA (never in mitosis gene a)-related kinase